MFSSDHVSLGLEREIYRGSRGGGHHHVGLPKRTNDLHSFDVTLSGYRFAMVPRRMASGSISESIEKKTHSTAKGSDTASLSSFLSNDTLTLFASGGTTRWMGAEPWTS